MIGFDPDGGTSLSADEFGAFIAFRKSTARCGSPCRSAGLADYHDALKLTIPGEQLGLRSSVTGDQELFSGE
jgi:hypothetical protein